LSADVGHVKDEVKGLRQDVRDSLLERKELRSDIDGVKENVDKVQSRLDEHIQNDIPVTTWLSGKIGALVMTGIVTVSTFVGMALLREWAQPFIEALSPAKNPPVVAQPALPREEHRPDYSKLYAGEDEPGTIPQRQRKRPVQPSPPVSPDADLPRPRPKQTIQDPDDEWPFDDE
jgi:hypothetical protein